MKFLNYLKSDAIINIKSFPTILAMVLVVPLLLVFVNGYSQRSMDPEKVKPPKNTVYIEGNGKYEELIKNTFESPSFLGYIEIVKELEKADFILEMNEEFYESIESGKIIPAKLITNSREASTRSGFIISSITQSVLREQIKFDALEEKLIGRETDAQALIDNVRYKAVNESDFDYKSVKTIEENNSYKRAALNSVSILIVIWISYLSQIYGNEQTIGYNKRIASMPISAPTKYLVDIINNTVVLSLILMIYIMIMRFIGWGFEVNLVATIMAAFVLSFLATAFGYLITSVLPKALATSIVFMLMLLIIFMSSMAHLFTKSENINPVLEFIVKINPSEKIYNLFLLIGDGLNTHLVMQLFSFTTIALSLTILGAVLASVRKDVKI